MDTVEFLFLVAIILAVPAMVLKAEDRRWVLLCLGVVCVAIVGGLAWGICRDWGPCTLPWNWYWHMPDPL